MARKKKDPSPGVSLPELDAIRHKDSRKGCDLGLMWSLAAVVRVPVGGLCPPDRWVC